MSFLLIYMLIEISTHWMNKGIVIFRHSLWRHVGTQGTKNKFVLVIPSINNHFYIRHSQFEHIISDFTIMIFGIFRWILRQLYASLTFLPLLNSIFFTLCPYLDYPNDNLFLSSKIFHKIYSFFTEWWSILFRFGYVNS